MRLDVVASGPNVGLGGERRVGCGRARAQHRTGRGCVHTQHRVGHGRVWANVGLGMDMSAPNLELGVITPGPNRGTQLGRVRAQLRVGRGCTLTQLGVGHPKKHSPILGYDFHALSFK